jgi:hypothetical protein
MFGAGAPALPERASATEGITTLGCNRDAAGGGSGSRFAPDGRRAGAPRFD